MRSLLLLAAMACTAEPPRPCRAPEGLGRPGTIADALVLLRALPPDADASCLVASLDRPLEVVATTSRTSAQPAASPTRPRLFLMEPGLVMSVVAGGPAAPLLEFGEVVGRTESLKAEVELPLAPGTTEADAHTRVVFDETTTGCGFCHRAEAVFDEVDGVPRHVSEALKPVARTLVPLDELRAFRSDCAPDDASCDVLRALLDHGEVRQGAFDQAIPTFH